MRKEVEALPVSLEEARRKSSFFRELENSAPELLERCLGINFGQTFPRVVEYDGKNIFRVVLAKDKQGCLGCAGKIGTLLSFVMKLAGKNGEYNPDLDIIFYYRNKTPSRPLSTELHENIHGWQKRINSEVLNGNRKILVAIQNRTLNKTDVSAATTEISYGLADVIIAEGVAWWGSMHVAENFLGDQAKSEARERKNIFFSGEKGRIGENICKPTREMLNIVLGNVNGLYDGLNRCVSKVGIKSVTSAAGLTIKGFLGRVVGYYFVDGTIRKEHAKSPSEIGKVLEDITRKQWSVGEILNELNKLKE